jgi:hypothetical protein
MVVKHQKSIIENVETISLSASDEYKLSCTHMQASDVAHAFELFMFFQIRTACQLSNVLFAFD